MIRLAALIGAASVMAVSVNAPTTPSQRATATRLLTTCEKAVHSVPLVALAAHTPRLAKATRRARAAVRKCGTQGRWRKLNLEDRTLRDAHHAWADLSLGSRDYAAYGRNVSRGRTGKSILHRARRKVARGREEAKLALAELRSFTLRRLSSDPFTNSTSQHRTEVEPDTFAYGSTIVAVFQVGRFFDGGSDDIGFATSNDNGRTWHSGLLPGITGFVGGGGFSRVSDPSVAFDARHNVWLVSSLVLIGNNGVGVVTSRSADGGHTWSAPVTVATTDADKNWIVCDNTAASPFFGHCYTEWDQPSGGQLMLMSTSADGGLTWSSALTSADSAHGWGGQPVVQPDGTVIVPFLTPPADSIRSFSSATGGASWSTSAFVASLSDHRVAGGLRTEPLPSAGVDAAGEVYLVWQDCRFRANCSSNDLVLTTTTQSQYPAWSAVRRIPIDPVTSTVDHFIPGLAVNPATSGAETHLGLAYYYYPNAACDPTTCQLEVGYVSSSDGGSRWSSPSELAGPMLLDWLALTNQGRMVGDYISSSYVRGGVVPVFASASAPAGGVFNESMFAPRAPLPG
ncbi:MAG TPA: sialidase family protein [Gaiellaceae bacterium]|nr:sialidase family protein [Gaiellaceae bacterium]